MGIPLGNVAQTHTITIEMGVDFACNWFNRRNRFRKSTVARILKENGQT